MAQAELANATTVHFTRPLKARNDIVHSFGSTRKKTGTEYETEFALYSRLTVGTEIKGYDRLDFCGKYKTFDIIAARPKKEHEVAALAARVDVDVICIDSIPSLQLIKPQMGEAMRRGIYFELSYSDAICEKMELFRFVRNMRQLVRITHGKQLILSNGSDQRANQRGPYDVANM